MYKFHLFIVMIDTLELGCTIWWSSRTFSPTRKIKVLMYFLINEVTKHCSHYSFEALTCVNNYFP